MGSPAIRHLHHEVLLQGRGEEGQENCRRRGGQKVAGGDLLDAHPKGKVSRKGRGYLDYVHAALTAWL